MKRLFLTLGIALLSSGILFAQITVNATDGINLGNVLKVTSNNIKISKKISSDEDLEYGFGLPKPDVQKPLCNTTLVRNHAEIHGSFRC